MRPIWRAPGSEKFAEVRRGLPRAYVEPALSAYLERRARRVGAPRFPDPRLDLAADDRHPLGRLRAEVVLARRDDAGGHAPAVSLEPDALHVTVEGGVVLQHGEASGLSPIGRRGQPPVTGSPSDGPVGRDSPTAP